MDSPTVTTLPVESQPVAQPARACVAALAGYRFAVEVRYAREVVVFDEYTIVPLAPSHLLGVANLRGAIVPVVDVRPLLGLAGATDAREIRALLAEADGLQVGFLIDEVLGLEPLDALTASEDPAAGGMVAGRLERPGGAVDLLDVHAVVAALAAGASA